MKGLGDCCYFFLLILFDAFVLAIYPAYQMGMIANSCIRTYQYERAIMTRYLAGLPETMSTPGVCS